MQFGIRELVFIITLLAMPVAAWFFVFQPRNAQIAEARQEITKKQQKLQQLEMATARISDLGVEIDKLSQAVDLFEDKLPPQREVEVIVKQVWEMAAKNRVAPKSIRSEKVAVGQQYSEQSMKMAITGDFDGFYSFMLDLEKLSRITRVPKMMLKKVDNEQGQMQADMILQIYFDSSDPAAPSPAGRDRL